MHQCIHDHPLSKYSHSGKWDGIYKVSFWNGKGTGATFTQGYLHDPDDEDCVKIKLHRDRLVASDLPTDLTGWECFVSMDDQADETYGQATVTKFKKRGRHRIAVIPDGSPKILTP